MIARVRLSRAFLVVVALITTCAGNVLLRGGLAAEPTTLERSEFEALVADKCDV